MRGDRAGRATQTIETNLAGRVGALLVAPRAEWSRVDAEPAAIGGADIAYVLLLAAIGPIAGFLGAARPPLAAAAAAGPAFTGYALTLAATGLLALALAALARPFGGRAGLPRAFKLVAYASTAAWLARIVLIWPVVPLLSLGLLASLYSAWLLWLGVPRLMHLPAGRAALFSGVAIVGALGLNLATALAVRALFAP